MRNLILWMTIGLVVIGGCADKNGGFGGGVKSLTADEISYLQKLRDRLSENQAALDSSLAIIQRLGRDYMKEEGSLKTSIAKAKLLESMKSPWSNPGPKMAETQRAVALYLMYDLAESERVALQARVEERRASLAALSDAHARLRSLVDQAIENERLILSELNAPPSGQIALVTAEFLRQTTAFHTELAKSDNPKLKALAERVAAAEDKVSKAKDKIEAALSFLEKKE